MKPVTGLNQTISKITAFPWLPEFLAGFAGIVYLVQSVSLAFTQWSVIDEGNYSYKGWLFATGQYIPFQDYGPWTNHMPLSFLIFGYVQLLFGPGLRTIRYFMVFVGLLLLLAMWLTTRRLAGRWAAAACLWFLALNPFAISDYSVGIAEGLVACSVTWMLYFTLGEERSLWELLAGSVLAAVLVLIRENMLILLPFVFIYVFWQHGKRVGLLFTGVCATLLLAVTGIFLPGILGVWAKWMPKFLSDYFLKWVFPGKFTHPGNVALSKKILVVFNSVQTNFMAVFAPLMVGLCWPRDGFKNRAQLRTVAFLFVSFIVLYGVHAWASLGKNYCAYCLINYATFFSPIGLLLFFAFLPGISERRPVFPAWLAAVVILLLATGIGYSNYEKFGNALAVIDVPRVSRTGIQPGTIELWRVLANKFSVSFQFLRSLLPTIAGTLVGILLLGLGYVVARIGKRKGLLSNMGYAFLLVTSVTALVLSPTQALGGIAANARCDKDILAQYEKVGAELAQRVPAGAQVYWRGSPSPALLLYLPGIKIYPPQLNGGFGFTTYANSQQALRFGFWNAQLDRKWRTQADVLLIRASELSLMNVKLSPQVFDELPTTSPVFLCAPDDTRIRIFERK